VSSEELGLTCADSVDHALLEASCPRSLRTVNPACEDAYDPMADSDSRTGVAFIIGAVLAGLVGFGLGKSQPNAALPAQQDKDAEQGLALLDYLEHTRRDGVFYFFRLSGVSYGKGFEQACSALGANKKACRSAWQIATDACVQSDPDHPVCIPPPGYFDTPTGAKKRVRSTFDRYILEAFGTNLCIEFASPAARDTELAEVCDEILSPGPWHPDA
jgi:hypothetical protein